MQARDQGYKNKLRNSTPLKHTHALVNFLMYYIVGGLITYLNFKGVFFLSFWLILIFWNVGTYYHSKIKEAICSFFEASNNKPVKNDN